MKNIVTSVLNVLRRRQMAKRIPVEVYRLLATLRSKYEGLVLDKSETVTPNEKLDLLIDQINNDLDLRRLGKIRYIGSIEDFEPSEKCGAGGYGTNLCLGPRGLTIYTWNDNRGSYVEVPATSASLIALKKRFTAEMLKEAILDYVAKENYIKRALDFRMF
ncbi:hypothetical protein KW799_01440 [Candidatus Parcubacteria bacterium]|nr:hypothetical protein [Candidatus Parcubacteria bacterium]